MCIVIDCSKIYPLMAHKTHTNSGQSAPTKLSNTDDNRQTKNIKQGKKRQIWKHQTQKISPK